MTDAFAWRCKLCDAPTTDNVTAWLGDSVYREYEQVHRVCCDAWVRRDTETLARLRKEACEAGHHRWPGQWTTDSADPYGDAQFWECTKGCGHVQRHPGYGHKRAVAEMLARREGSAR